jgi:biopolymer transport protein TolR
MPFGRLERTPPSAPMSDINMTPLIDVMLVLLVIFLVTAPLMASSLKLDLPAAGAAATPASLQQALQVSMQADGTVRLDGEPLAADAWRERLVQAARENPATEVHLRADRRVPYGEVAAFIDAAQQAGLSRIGFATEPAATDAPAPATR